MPELRKDPIVGRWVIISTERGKRPSDFPMENRRRDVKLCPFCPGNESSTPPEIMAIRDDGSKPNSPGWTLRVIPNKFPALRIEGDLNREGMGIFDKMNGIGAHEVVIETPDHQKDMVDLDQRSMENVIWAFRERIVDLKRDPRFRHIIIFKNQGEAAGASLEHSHSQLIATPIVPKRVREEIEGSHDYNNYKTRCVYCDIIREENRFGIRIVYENVSFVSYCPYASRFPFEIWILPKRHMSGFQKATHQELIELADCLGATMKRLAAALGSPQYNYMLHTEPNRSVPRYPWPDIDEYYHWHFEIIPKLTRVAGFEWGTGFYINPTAPEDAASYLREVDIE